MNIYTLNSFTYDNDKTVQDPYLFLIDFYKLIRR